jgi:hypothetical protein
MRAFNQEDENHFLGEKEQVYPGIHIYSAVSAYCHDL